MEERSYNCRKQGLRAWLRMLKMFTWLMTTLQFLASAEQTVRICVVPFKEGTSENQAAIAAMDVKKLAAELSLSKLANASPIVSVPVFGRDRRDVDALLERDECEYIVSIWRYESADGNYNLPANLPDIALPQESATPMPVGDRDLIFYKLRAKGKRKDLYSGSAFPPTVRSRSHVVISPYPSMAAQIVKSLNRFEGSR